MNNRGNDVVSCESKSVTKREAGLLNIFHSSPCELYPRCGAWFNSAMDGNRKLSGEYNLRGIGENERLAIAASLEHRDED